MAVQGKLGIVEGVDYRGHSVLSSIQPIPATNWFLITKIDTDELFAPLRRKIGLVGMFFLICLVIAILSISLQQKRRDSLWLSQLNLDLEKNVDERTRQLTHTMNELEAFSYSVSHDLRAPLRAIDGWSLALLEDCYEQLDHDGKQHLDRVRQETRRMSDLIDNLMQLSRLSKQEIKTGQVDLSRLVNSLFEQLKETEPERNVELHIQPDLSAQADPNLMEIALFNLAQNAWKFTRTRDLARIEFGRTLVDGNPAYYMKDNGVGFNMNYAKKIFAAFQRFHKESEFPGTGVGLATVQRIIQRSGGTIWAVAEVNEGATFYFTL
jgi:light-regulated signal transduction histidine kinase (bacteriophytochrome)